MSKLAIADKVGVPSHHTPACVAAVWTLKTATNMGLSVCRWRFRVPSRSQASTSVSHINIESPCGCSVRLLQRICRDINAAETLVHHYISRWRRCRKTLAMAGSGSSGEDTQSPSPALGFDHSPRFLIPASLLYAISLALTAARLCSRVTSDVGLKWSDYTLILANVSAASSYFPVDHFHGCSDGLIN